jgi:Family of unknown function (DUF6152)
MNFKFGVGMIVAGLTLAALPVMAHHSFAAEYDSTKPVTIKGKFVKMDWINPHSWIYMDVTGTDGKVSQWKFEALPPNGLYRQGWRRDSLKPGEEITIQGFLAKDGTNTAWSSSVTGADGKRMFAGQADAAGGPGAPPPQTKQ